VRLCRSFLCRSLSGWQTFGFPKNRTQEVREFRVNPFIEDVDAFVARDLGANKTGFPEHVEVMRQRRGRAVDPKASACRWAVAMQFRNDLITCRIAQCLAQGDDIVIALPRLRHGSVISRDMETNLATGSFLWYRISMIVEIGNDL